MFYPDYILTARPEIALYWLAAFSPKELKKKDWMEADVGKGCDYIREIINGRLTSENGLTVRLSLRTSSHLILGLIRVYHLQVNQLYKDADALQMELINLRKPKVQRPGRGVGGPSDGPGGPGGQGKKQVQDYEEKIKRIIVQKVYDSEEDEAEYVPPPPRDPRLVTMVDDLPTQMPELDILGNFGPEAPEQAAAQGKDIDKMLQDHREQRKSPPQVPPQPTADIVQPDEPLSPAIPPTSPHGVVASPPFITTPKGTRKRKIVVFPSDSSSSFELPNGEPGPLYPSFHTPSSPRDPGRPRGARRGRRLRPVRDIQIEMTNAEIRKNLATSADTQRFSKTHEGHIQIPRYGVIKGPDDWLTGPLRRPGLQFIHAKSLHDRVCKVIDGGRQPDWPDEVFEEPHVPLTPPREDQPIPPPQEDQPIPPPQDQQDDIPMVPEEPPVIPKITIQEATPILDERRDIDVTGSSIRVHSIHKSIGASPQWVNGSKLQSTSPADSSPTTGCRRTGWSPMSVSFGSDSDFSLNESEKETEREKLYNEVVDEMAKNTDQVITFRKLYPPKTTTKTVASRAFSNFLELEKRDYLVLNQNEFLGEIVIKMGSKKFP